MKATETTILKFIGGEDKVFIIPPFQRNKDRKSKNLPEFDPILSENKVFVNAGKKIGSSKYYVEGNISCSRARFFANLLLQQYGFVDSCTIKVDKKSD